MGAVIFLLLIPALLWLMIVPQRRQAKAQRELLATLEAGDAVMTTAGIYGIVTEFDGDDMYLEVADGIELKMTRASVVRRIIDDADETTGAPAEGK